MDLQAFLARVAHDLKSPARQMGSIVQLLSSDSELGEDQLQIVEMLKAISEKGVLQVEGLSQFAHGIDVDDSSCSLNFAEVLRSAAKPFDAIKIHGEERLDFVLQYNLQGLKTILREIVSNAVKFAPADVAPELHVSTEISPENGSRVLCFKSPSIGVQHGQVEKLLSPYSRDARAAKTEGHGMGLTVVSYLVDQSGGRVWLQCDEDQFSVYWQLAPQAELDVSSAA